MTVHTFLDWLQGTPVAHSISKSHHLVGAGLQVVHIVGFIALLAAAVLLTLRALGLVFRDYDLRRLEHDLRWPLWGGLVLTVASGVLMFVATPKLYYYNKAFDLKIVLLPVAVLLQAVLFRRLALARDGAARAVVSLASVATWFTIGIAGRAIGFI